MSGQGRGASFSFGQYHYETSGFRENNDFDDDIYNVFFQNNLSYKTSVQGEFRFRKTENGDLTLRFLPDDFLPNFLQEDETTAFRLGFHTAFSPGSDLIGNFAYQKQDIDAQDRPPFPVNSFALTEENQAFSGELGYLYRSTNINVVSGVGHFNVDRDVITTLEVNIPIIPPPPPPIPPFVLVPIVTPLDFDVDHTNIYLYSYINFLENVTFTVGASADLFNSDESSSFDRDQINPKFGVTWNPVPDTTLRGSVFRVLKRTLTTNQTLEPTQVAGFNQFFDDDDSADTWNYGIAVDQVFSKNMYGGAEYFIRDQESPVIDLTGPTPVVSRKNRDEDLARAYLYWTPKNWWAFSAQYLYEKFERDELLSAGIKDLESHRVPLGINFFHPSGLNVSLRFTYFDQEGDFERQSALGIFEHGEDDFWLADAAIGYRLPKRFGFVTIGATNLFDESFQYFDTDPNNPAIQPERFFFVRLTLSI